MNNVNHDSRDSKRGDFYQPLIAILYALTKPNLFHFEKLTIEHEGDVSFDNKIQIESKHHKNGNSLGDTNEEFWKSLYNWLNQKKNFEELVLHTTSHFPKKGISKLKKWNDTTVDGRIDIINEIDFGYNLEEINDYKFSKINLEILNNLGVTQDKMDLLTISERKTYSETELSEILENSELAEPEIKLIKKECKNTTNKKYQNWNYSRFILSCGQELLKEIISKLRIESSQKTDKETVIEISQTPTFRGVCKTDKDFAILIEEKLAGAIASKVVGEKRWELSNEKFYAILNEAKTNFYKENYKPIFDKYLSKEPTEEELEKHSELSFYKELSQMNCESDELMEATVDYWKTNTLISEELDSNPFFVHEEYMSYRNSIIRPKIVNNKRLEIPTDSQKENLKKSLLFYRKTKAIEFRDFNGIKSFPYFTHGTMNNIVEDENEDFNWIIND